MRRTSPVIITLILLNSLTTQASEPMVSEPAVSDEATSVPSAAVPSFRNEVMAVLSRSGCSLGTCHANQNGKGGLKLSLRGQDPNSDYLTLTRQLAGRRSDVMNPND